MKKKPNIKMVDGVVAVECSDCLKLCLHLGGTVGGIQLYGCPDCRVVYWIADEETRRGV